MSGPSFPSLPPSWVLHPEEVAVLDRNAEALGVPVQQLMHTAGQALARCAVEILASEYPYESSSQGTGVRPGCCILCGPGNNGGDGFAAALQLKQDGYPVLLVASAAKQRSTVAQQFRQQCSDSGIEIWDSRQTEGLAQRLQSCHLLIDCLLGAGFHCSPKSEEQQEGQEAQVRGTVAELLRLCRDLQLRGSLPRVLACDLPSALGTGFALQALRTISFHAPKLPMYEHASGTLRPELGEMQVAPLPWPAETLDCGPGEFCRFPALNSEAHKGQRGRLLVIGGGPYHGAPMLAAQAAARSACDLVHLAMPQGAAKRCYWPLHLICETLPLNANPARFDGRSSQYLLQRCQEQHFDAILLGPGLGRHPETLDAIWQLLQELLEQQIPLVLDADALYLLSRKSSGRWPTSPGGKPLQGIVTPHRKELESWLGTAQSGITPVRVLQDIEKKWEKQMEANQQEQQVIVCTGSSDVLTGKNGRLAHARGGYPRMACAGSGDMLAGICASLLAQGMSPWAAARLATQLLRRSGGLAAEEYGMGLLADDVLPYIAKALSCGIQDLAL